VANLSTPYSTTPARPMIDTTQPGCSPAIAERLLEEGLLSLRDAARLLPPVRGKHVSTSSLFRWAMRGKLGIRLEYVRLNGPGIWTTKQALARFAAGVTTRSQAAAH
jgi:hypothetical protein